MLPELCSHLPILRPRMATSAIATITPPVSAKVASLLPGIQEADGPIM